MKPFRDPGFVIIEGPGREASSRISTAEKAIAIFKRDLESPEGGAVFALVQIWPVEGRGKDAEKGDSDAS